MKTVLVYGRKTKEKTTALKELFGVIWDWNVDDYKVVWANDEVVTKADVTILAGSPLDIVTWLSQSNGGTVYLYAEVAKNCPRVFTRVDHCRFR